jgi:hypothetical protein
MLSVLLLACVSLYGPAETFSSTYLVPDPVRLAITPKIDGTLSPDEWDTPFVAVDHQASYQWEPGWHYLCGKLPLGRDLLVSFDFKSDGWLIGKDNLQVRVTQTNAGPKTQLSMLDATDPIGPKWVPCPLLESVVTAATETKDGSWTVEIGFRTVGLPAVEPGGTLALRTDTIPSDAAMPEAFLPRNVTRLDLQMEKAHHAPANLSWKADYKGRSVAPGDSLRIRVAVKNASTMRRFEMFTEGLAQEDTSRLSEPFPNGRENGRAVLAYDAKVSPNASVGYRVLRAKLIDETGSEVWLRSSYLISDLVTFEPRMPDNLRSKQNDSQIVRGRLVIRSHTRSRIDGKLRILVPTGWTVTKGNDAGFTIYHSRGSAAVNLEIIIPPNVSGIVPISYSATVGDRVIERSIPLIIEPGMGT